MSWISDVTWSYYFSTDRFLADKNIPKPIRLLNERGYAVEKINDKYHVWKIGQEPRRVVIYRVLRDIPIDDPIDSWEYTWAL